MTVRPAWSYAKTAGFGTKKRRVFLQGLTPVRQFVQESAYRDLLQNGLPPLDPTRFSFWALRFVVGPVDTPSRINWLASQSTRARLQHTIDLCEEYLRVRAQAEAEGNRGNSENSGGDGGGGGGV